MPVQRRPAGFVSRTVVPHDLRPAIGRREIVRNLKTGSSREAKRRAAEFEGHVAALFRRLRHDAGMMDRERIDALVAEYLKASLDEVEETLAEGLSLSCEVGRDVWQDEVIEKLQEIEGSLSEGDHSATLTTAQAMLPNGSSTAIAVLSRRLLEAKYEGLCAELKALQGKPLRRMVTTPALVAAVEPPKPSPPLAQMVADYASFKKSGGKWTPKTALQLLNLFRVMVEMVGDKPVRDITKEDMRELYRPLPQMPAHATKRYPGMIATDTIAAADADGQDERLSPKTQNDYFTHIKSLFKWAVESDYLDKSVWVVDINRRVGRLKTKNAYRLVPLHEAILSTS